MKEVKLKVAEATQDDVNKGIVRIDSAYMRELGVRPGDAIELMGEKNTVGIVDRALPGDIGLNIIRMDGLIRRNSKTSIGELVSIKKAEIKDATKVVIAPAREGILIKGGNTYFKQGLMGRPVVKDDLVSIGSGSRVRRFNLGDPFIDEMFGQMGSDFMMPFGLGDLKFIVTETVPKGPVMISQKTELIYNPDAVKLKEDKGIDISYEDIGGLDDEIKKVREMVELPLKHPEVFERLGIEPPKGVLLHGPPGTGKTLLAKAVANETNSNFILINGPEIMSKYYGQSEENLRKKFEEAEKNAPSIVFIDEIDAIASKREESKGEVERRVVAQLLAVMDGLKTRGKVVVMAATNIPNSLDPALRRPGRFDREIEIGVPQKAGRLKILKIHTRNMPIDGSPESVNPLYKRGDLTNAIKAITDSANAVEVLTIVPKEVKSYLEMDLILEEELIKLLKQYTPKDVDKPTRDFLKLCLPNIANFLISRMKDKLKLENGKVIIEPSLSNIIDAKLDEYKNDQVVDALIYDSVKDDVLDAIAGITHGFVGADLASLAREAAMILLRRVLPDLNLDVDEELSPEMLDKLKVTKKDLTDALKVVRPSALREVLIENPNISMADIGGLKEVKAKLEEAVEWPLKTPEVFTRMGIKPPKGILLYGPPGTGKTLLAKAIASETEANFIQVKGPELISKWVGESEKAIRKIFGKARQASPSIIFFDEIDAIASRRGTNESSKAYEGVVNQLLTEMDGMEDLKDVVVIAASNRPDIIDTALLRPGRFDRIILVPVPDEFARREIINVHLKGVKINKDVDVDQLVKLTDNYVGADIESLIREAAIIAIRENIKAKEVEMRHFNQAIKFVRASSSKEINDMYKELEGQFKSARAKEMAESKPAYYG